MSALRRFVKACRSRNFVACTSERFSSSASQRAPVTILTGFLGSGKTTLLNRILAHNHGKRIAVIQNEFGAVAVDDALTWHHFRGNDRQGHIYVMNNGCICCTFKDDLSLAISDMFGAAEKTGIRLDHVIVETTGVAKPGPIAQVFMTDPVARKHVKFNGIITMVDAKHTLPHLKENKLSGIAGQMKQQISMADLVIVNKLDLLVGMEGAAQLEELRTALTELNPHATVLEAHHADVPVDHLIDVRFQDDCWRSAAAGCSHLGGHGPDLGGENHLEGITTVSIVGTKPVELQAFYRWIQELVDAHGENLYRMKGIVPVAGRNSQKLSFQGVHNVISGEFIEDRTDEMASRMVFIGRGLDADLLRVKLERCIAEGSEPFLQRDHMSADGSSMY